VVSVLGPTAPYVHVLAGGAAGKVVVPFPANDTVAATKLAADEDVNLLIRVFDKPPGSPDTNAVYVAAAIGIDPWGTLGELSGVSGTVIPLRAGMGNGFHQATRSLGIAVPPPDPGGSNPPPPYCSEVPAPGSGTWNCYSKDFPSNAQHVLVPIASNHGAGNDMRSLITYGSTKVTKTSIAVQGGVPGFVEANGTASFEKENDITLEWRPQGPNQDEVAELDTTYVRERVGWCVKADDASWECTIDTTYRPYQAIGSYDGGGWGINDHMDTAQDCWAPVSLAFQPATKSSTSLTFQFRLGEDENWATTWLSPVNPGTFYANTTITQQTGSGVSHIRRWEVVAQYHYPYHYVYVPYGQYGMGTSLPNSKCVGTRLGDVRTDADTVDYEHLPSKGPYAPPPSDPTDDEQKTEAPVCGNMPDRCD